MKTNISDPTLHVQAPVAVECKTQILSIYFERCAYVYNVTSYTLCNNIKTYVLYLISP